MRDLQAASRTDRRRLRILTWHVHGNYLWYLSHVPHDFFLPVKPGRPPGYGGRGATFPWPTNVHEVAAEGHHRFLHCLRDLVVRAQPADNGIGRPGRVRQGLSKRCG